MDLVEKFGIKFIITTELGPVKGVLTDESLDKARSYLPLDGINIHDCPMAHLLIDVPEDIISRMEQNGVTGVAIACDFIKEISEHADGIHIMAMGDVQSTNTIIEFANTLTRR